MEFYKMKKTILPFFILVMCLGTTSSWAQNPASPADQKATFVKGTRLLEQDPFAKDAKRIRSALLMWLIEAPDVSVTLCSEFLEPVGKKFKYAPELTGQFTYGMGAFIIENPSKAGDQTAVYAGGLESASRMYEAMLKAKPEAKDAFLDSLVETRTKGETAAYVESVLKKGGCKRKN